MSSLINLLDTKTQFCIIKICLFLFLRFNQITAENGEEESKNYVYQMNLQKVYYLVNNNNVSVTLNVEGLMYLKVTGLRSYVASFEKMSASISTKSSEKIDIGSSPQFKKIGKALQKPSRVTISKSKMFSKMEVDKNEPILATNFKLFIFGTMQVDSSKLGIGDKLTETEEDLFWGQGCRTYYLYGKGENDTYYVRFGYNPNGCTISFSKNPQESDDKFLKSTICKPIINLGYYPTSFANATVYRNKKTYYYPVIINYSYEDTFTKGYFHINTTVNMILISTNTDESINKFEVKNTKSVNQPIYRNLNRKIINSINKDDLHKVYKLLACKRILNSDASTIEIAIEVDKFSDKNKLKYLSDL